MVLLHVDWSVTTVVTSFFLLCVVSQAIDELLEDVYHLTDVEIVALSSYHLLCSFGMFSPETHKEGFLKFCVLAG